MKQKSFYIAMAHGGADVIKVVDHEPPLTASWNEKGASISAMKYKEIHKFSKKVAILK